MTSSRLAGQPTVKAIAYACKESTSARVFLRRGPVPGSVGSVLLGLSGIQKLSRNVPLVEVAPALLRRIYRNSEAASTALVGSHHSSKAPRRCGQLGGGPPPYESPTIQLERPLAGARATSAPHQPVQPRRLLRLIEAFEHPDIVRPFGDGCEEALAVGMQTEPRDGVGRRRQIHGREHLVHSGLHINRVKPPLPALARRASEDAINLGSVFRKRERIACEPLICAPWNHPARSCTSRSRMGTRSNLPRETTESWNG